MDSGTFYILQNMSHDELRLWLAFSTMQKGADIRQLYDDVGRTCGKTASQVEQLMGQMAANGWFYQDPRTGNIQHGSKLREIAQQSQTSQMQQQPIQSAWPQQSAPAYQQQPMSYSQPQWQQQQPSRQISAPAAQTQYSAAPPQWEQWSSAQAPQQ